MWRPNYYEHVKDDIIDRSIAMIVHAEILEVLETLIAIQ